MREFSPELLFRRDNESGIGLRWEAFAYLSDDGAHLLFDEKQDIEIRLDQCDIISHDGLVWLLSAIRYRKAAKLGSTYVRLPGRDRASTLGFIRDLGFPDHVLMSGGFFTNEYVLTMYKNEHQAHRDREQPLSPRYIQYVEHSSWSPVVSALNRYFSNDLMKMLDEDGGLSDLSEASFPCRETMAELIVNVVLHGGPVHGLGSGYVCYRMFPAAHPRVRFCCNDLGPGFRATLEGGNEGLKLDGELAALKLGLLYRFYKPKEGVVGLYKSLPFVRRLNGRVLIRSQDVMLVLDLQDEQNAARFDAGFSKPTEAWLGSLVKSYRLPTIPGCHIALDLRLPGGRRERSR
jgi:hypothetical protein